MTRWLDEWARREWEEWGRVWEKYWKWKNRINREKESNNRSSVSQSSSSSSSTSPSVFTRTQSKEWCGNFFFFFRVSWWFLNQSTNQQCTVTYFQLILLLFLLFAFALLVLSDRNIETHNNRRIHPRNEAAAAVKQLFYNYKQAISKPESECRSWREQWAVSTEHSINGILNIII